MRHGHLGGVLKVLKNVVFFFTVYIERSICVDSWRVSTQKSTMSFSEVLRFGILFTRHIVDWKKTIQHFFFGLDVWHFWCHAPSNLFFSWLKQSKVFLMIETNQVNPIWSVCCMMYFIFFLQSFFCFCFKKHFYEGLFVHARSWFRCSCCGSMAAARTNQNNDYELWFIRTAVLSHYWSSACNAIMLSEFGWLIISCSLQTAGAPSAWRANGRAAMGALRKTGRKRRSKVNALSTSLKSKQQNF